MFLGAGGQAVSSAAVVMVLSRLLSPADFGVVGAALVVVSFAQVFTQFGVGPALVQMERISREHVHTAISMSLILGLCFAAGVYLLAGVSATFFGMSQLQNILRVLAILFPIVSLGAVGQALLQREMKFRIMARINLVSYLLGYALPGIFLAYLGLGMWALVAAQMGQSILSTILTLVNKRLSLQLALDLRVARQLVVFGGGYSLAQVANHVATQVDRLIVGRFLGQASLGIYSRTQQIAMLPTNLIGSVLDKVMFPAMASVQADHARLGRALVTSLTGVVLITMPVAAVLIALAPEVVSLLLGSQWTAVVGPFRILVSVLSFRAGYKILDSLARATGTVYQQAWRHWIYAALVALGTFGGQRLGGLPGVAAGVAVAVVMHFTLMLGLAVRLTDVKLTRVVASFSRHLVVGIALYLVVSIVKNVCLEWGWSDITVLFLSVAVAAGLWLLTVAIVPQVLGQEGSYMRTQVRRALRLNE